MYVPKPGQLCTIWRAGVYMPVVLGWIFGVRGVGGANFFNYQFHVYFNAISDNFENKFIGGSNVRIDSNLS